MALDIGADGFNRLLRVAIQWWGRAPNERRGALPPVKPIDLTEKMIAETGGFDASVMPDEEEDPVLVYEAPLPPGSLLTWQVCAASKQLWEKWADVFFLGALENGGARIENMEPIDNFLRVKLLLRERTSQSRHLFRATVTMLEMFSGAVVPNFIMLERETDYLQYGPNYKGGYPLLGAHEEGNMWLFGGGPLRHSFSLDHKLKYITPIDKPQQFNRIMNAVHALYGNAIPALRVTSDRLGAMWQERTRDNNPHSLMHIMLELDGKAQGRRVMAKMRADGTYRREGHKYGCKFEDEPDTEEKKQDVIELFDTDE